MARAWNLYENGFRIGSAIRQFEALRRLEKLASRSIRLTNNRDVYQPTYIRLQDPAHSGVKPSLMFEAKFEEVTI